MSGKCPNCGHFINTANIETMTVKNKSGSGFKGIAYTCPDCDVIISVQIDPLAVRNEIVSQVEQAIKKWK